MSRRDPSALPAFLEENDLATFAGAVADFGVETVHDLLTLVDEGEMRDDLGFSDGNVAALLRLQQAYKEEIKGLLDLPNKTESSEMVALFLEANALDPFVGRVLGYGVTSVHQLLSKVRPLE